MRFMSLLLLLGSLPVFAANEKFITRIHSIVYGEQVNEEHLLKFQNGRTGFMKAQLKTLHPKGELVQVEVDDRSTIIQIDKLIDSEETENNTPFITQRSYFPTLLRDYRAAQNLLKLFPTSPLKTSESFNRAHIWAYEGWRAHKLYSMKAFLFFSHRYIRKERPKIWFYVSPYVLHDQSGTTQEQILDQHLADKPMDFQTWSNRFMKNKAHCQFIKNYSVYYKKESSADCFVMKTSMYFWHPQELEILEIHGIHKVNFFDWELDLAYQSAFGI